MFQHYVLFWGKKPQEEASCSIWKDKHPKSPVGIESDEDKNETSPLINGEKEELGKFQRVLKLLRLT